ncbi:hypothetical protein D0859_07460 [Hortaea werneckii]|uniref:SprT-like domain-containing protein n=1 Tax=Hortaea werneckii TaxID=91943 RepID=A0A3M7ISI5_HORWE|nr:hypothetical protein D0859_07460 [Hortaea werneckii]
MAGFSPWSYPTNTFPTPNRNRDIYFPNFYNPRQLYANNRRKQQYHASLPASEKKFAVLRDKGLSHAGDLGWTLDYATAWCYRHLTGNQTGVVDAINHLREIEDVDEETPLIAFDLLDKTLFGHKLDGMVYLKWKTLPSSSPGITSAPGVVKGIPRVCIELNKLPFEDGDGSMDDLLDFLIHQMIHAYFLITCGAQPKGAEPDGRLMDGLHFGVLLLTIKDITMRCRAGELDLIFYTANRTGSNLNRRKNKFIAMNPRGAGAGLSISDGQSHCGHDNRYVRPAQMQNWQVETYSLAIELGMDSKGDQIYDIDGDSNFNAVDRLKGPPSSTYAELIWNEKRVMVPREKALTFESLSRPLEKNEKMELRVPECNEKVFCQLYNFFTCGSTQRDQSKLVIPDDEPQASVRVAPILAVYQRNPVDLESGVNVYLDLFKVAEAMKFEELMAHVLSQLWRIPYTTDDPIRTLQTLYNDNTDSGPVHAELHRWARGFLQRCEHDTDPEVTLTWAGYTYYSKGCSNYEKILQYFHDDFKDLFHRNAAFRDDCRTVAALLTREPDQEEGIPVPSTTTGGRLLLPSTMAMRPDLTATVTDLSHRRLAIDAGQRDPSDWWQQFGSGAVSQPLSLPAPASGAAGQPRPRLLGSSAAHPQLPLSLPASVQSGFLPGQRRRVFQGI